MIKTLRIVGFLFLFLMILVLILGIYSPSRILIQSTQHLQAPHSQVWQFISDPDKTSLWIDQIEHIHFIARSDFNNSSQFRYDLKSGKSVAISMEEFKTNDSLNFKLLEHQHNPMVQNYNLVVKLKALRDGSTEMNCKITYDIKSLTGKIANRLYFERSQKNTLEHTISSLKKYLEKV